VYDDILDAEPGEAEAPPEPTVTGYDALLENDAFVYVLTSPPTPPPPFVDPPAPPPTTYTVAFVIFTGGMNAPEDVNV
jgi:hypothetical protein